MPVPCQFLHRPQNLTGKQTLNNKKTATMERSLPACPLDKHNTVIRMGIQVEWSICSEASGDQISAPISQAPSQVVKLWCLAPSSPNTFQPPGLQKLPKGPITRFTQPLPKFTLSYRPAIVYKLYWGSNWYFLPAKLSFWPVNIWTQFVLFMCNIQHHKYM